MSSKSVSYSFDISDWDILKRKMLQWANQSNIFLFLDSNGYAHTKGNYECICGKGAEQIYHAEDLHAITHPSGKWLMGHLSYDLKNQLETRLDSRHNTRFGFSPAQLFVPAEIAFVERGTPVLHVFSSAPEQTLSDILRTPEPSFSTPLPKVSWEQQFDRGTYIRIIEQSRMHIREGDCYEINFCNSNTGSGRIELDPLQVFLSLNRAAPNPFAAFYKWDHLYAICASPERFLLRQGDTLTAQPIKGTTARSADPVRDAISKQLLAESIKERAENVMITDLMRNYLARVCETGSVTVEELFGLYSFPKVHQMISTVSGTLKKDVSFYDILRCTFPMGSMTGAPKIKVMQLIDRYETTRRELFSGSLGYITPNGDFDLNVMIRSLFYNSNTGLLGYQTGGAITYDSVALQEWEETRLKASAIEGIFSR
ncbi:MAG: anthranilate synthase component I family protein [Chitinophagaceae bacterium]